MNLPYSNNENKLVNGSLHQFGITRIKHGFTNKVARACQYGNTEDEHAKSDHRSRQGRCRRQASTSRAPTPAGPPCSAAMVVDPAPAQVDLPAGPRRSRPSPSPAARVWVPDARNCARLKSRPQLERVRERMKEEVAARFRGKAIFVFSRAVHVLGIGRDGRTGRKGQETKQNSILGQIAKFDKKRAKKLRATFF